MSLISLAKLVSEVAGRVEYSELDISFFPPSLYLIWLNPQRETRIIFTSWIYFLMSEQHKLKGCSHLTEQLCGLFSVLCLQSFRQQRIQASARLLPSIFFIFHLQTSTKTNKYHFSVNDSHHCYTAQDRCESIKVWINQRRRRRKSGIKLEVAFF